MAFQSTRPSRLPRHRHQPEQPIDDWSPIEPDHVESGLPQRTEDGFSLTRFLTDTAELSLARGNGLGWLAAGLGTGLLTYFCLPYEPALWATSLATFALVALAIAARRTPSAFAAILAASIMLGTLIGGFHTALHPAPTVLTEEVTQLRGRIETVEQRDANRARLVLSDLWFEDRMPEETPQRIRITAWAEPGALKPGQIVETLAQIGPPPEPVMPGARNLRRELFFAGIDATGFSYGRPKIVEQLHESGPLSAARASIERLRGNLAARYTAQIDGDAGVLIATLLVGKREGLPDETYEALRRAGLAHLLAISGMHMALMTLSALVLVQTLLGLSARQSTSHKTVVISAVAALGLAAGYLLLSGAGTATQRAFVMVALALVALMIGRRALTIRAVALAAIIVMVLSPHSLLGPSFQMSFAATTALVACYAALNNAPAMWSIRSALRGQSFMTQLALSPARALVGIALTSLIAGLATAPFAAYHFSVAAPLGLIGNLLAMPIVSLVVMPAGLLVLLATPFALESVPLWLMGQGIEAVLAVAHTMADWSGARLPVPALHPGALLALTASGLLAALLIGRSRWLAVLPFLAIVPL